MLLSDYKKADYIKKHHLFGGMGDNCKWGPWLLPLYPELIIIHDNVAVHKTAHILTHDMINGFINRCNIGIEFKSNETLGPVEIHDNVYISMDATIMPNVEIGSNCMISSGAVVSNDIPGNSLVAGNPGKVIGRFDTYAALRSMYAGDAPAFKNQFVPKELAKAAWDKFHASRQKVKK